MHIEINIPELMITKNEDGKIMVEILIPTKEEIQKNSINLDELNKSHQEDHK